MRVRVVVVAVMASCSSPSSTVRTEPPASAPPATAAAPAPVAAATAATAAAPGPAGPPRARTVDVTETHFGITVSDPYRWMEGNDNPEATAWLVAQGNWTRGYLARIPGHDALLARIRELGNATGAAARAEPVAGKLFYFRTAPGEQLPRVMVREAGKQRVLVDPAAFAASTGHASVDGFSASPDGARLAFNVSTGGGETAAVHVLDLATGKQLADRVDRVPGAARVTWLPDSTGFFYVQKVAEGRGVDPMLDPQMRLHILGTPAEQDAGVLGSAVRGVAVAPNEWSIALATGSARWVLAEIAGARSEARIVVAPVAAIDRSGAGRTPWHAVAGYDDGVAAATVHGDRVYLRSYKGASNFRIISLDAAHPDAAAARVEVAEDPQARLVDMAAARDALYLVKSVNGSARLLRWAWRGQPTEIALPFDGWIDELTADPARDGVLFEAEGWTHPAAYYSYVPGKNAVVADALAMETNADYAGIVADEVEATSADGARVPLSILHRADVAHDGARPAIVLGYGGYGISETPTFSPTRLAWLERGGVYAICHVRGGGEKGHAWRVDGMQERKINGIHDLEACAQALIDARLSSPAHLFARGGSMGGVLIGRAITDRPDLFAAANILVGIVNPLRLLAAKNGPTQIPEVGDPETEAGFRALAAMDPYQHVVAAAYPATMFSIGLNDARVSPWMTGKMAARMQALTASGKPVVIRVDSDAGHGIGSQRDQTFTALADEWSFFLAASGDPSFQPR
jgi:prolyl oligopeptidase